MAKRVKFVTKKLRVENYDEYYSRHSTLTTVAQLNEILHLHGYFMLRTLNCRKMKILDALGGISNLLNPRQSTLDETLSSCNPVLTVDEVTADLTALNWQEEFHVESLQSFSFATNNADDHDIHTSDVAEKRQMKKVRKHKKGKVFDALHPTKPRSKKSVPKRKRLTDISETDRVFG